MSLKAQLKELKEAQAEESVIEEVVEEVIEEPEQKTEEVAPIDDQKEEETPLIDEEEKPKSPTDHRKERLAAKAAEKRELEDLRQQVEELRKPKEEVKIQDDPEPDRNTKWGEWQEWNTRRLEKQVKNLEEAVLPAVQQQAEERQVQSAIQEFKTYEAKFSKTVDDYNPAASFLEAKLVDSISTLYPTMSDAQVTQAVNKQLLQIAGTFAAQGLDPAEELYHLAHDKGYAKTEVKEEKLKPDMKKVAENRRRNAGTAATQGTAKAMPGLAQLAGDVQAWKRLKPQERLNYLKQLQGN